MPETTDPPTDATAVRTQLRALKASEAFRDSDRHRRLLEFLVESTLRGEAAGLKEFVIAAEVWGRDVSFDPRIHSTVRVEVGRLRARLQRHYAQAGAQDAIRFRIPTGGYAVVFESGSPAPSSQPGGEPRFEMLSLIGRGGMGEVWSARDRRLHRNVALKFISPQFARNRAARERFEREARAAAALNHPNICTIYDVGEADGQSFLAMELLEGETLEHRLQEAGVPMDSLVIWGIEIADALEAAHSHGIVHSDLKPGNLFLTSRGQTKILDFGLARLATESSGGTEKLTAGTPGYMSPEQVNGEALDPRSDLFSLGIVLYRAACGRLPERMPGPPSSYNRQVPPELDRIIAKALEPDRDIRYQHASELRADLKRLKRDSEGSIASDPAVPLVPGSPTASSGLPRLPAWGWAALLSVLLVTAAGLYWHFRPSQTPTFERFSVAKASDSQNVQLTAISRDGKYLATVHKDATGKQSLWVRHLSSNSDRKLLDDARFVYKRMMFSPDASYVYFRAAALEKAAAPRDDIFRVPLIGGDPGVVIQWADSQFSFFDGGQRLCFYRGDHDKNTFEFIGASADGGDEKVLARGVGPLPSVSECSPDGARAALNYHGDRIDILDFAAGRSTVLLHPGSKSGTVYSLNWTPDGKGLIVASARASTAIAQLGFVSYPAGEYREITNNLNTYLHGVSLTADGATLATTEGRDESTFYLAPLSDPARMTVAPFTWVDAFTWIGKDKLLAVGADSVLKIADLSAPEGTVLRLPRGVVLNEASKCGPGSIVADGGTTEDVSQGIFRIDLDGNNLRQLTHGKRDSLPQCTPDAKWLLYMDYGDGTHPALTRVPMAGGTPQRVDGAEGSIFSVSPDGKLVVLVEYDEAGRSVLVLFSTANWREVRRIPLAVSTNRSIVFSRDSRVVYFVSRENGTGSIWQAAVDGSSVKQLLATPGRNIICIEPSLDGTQIGFSAHAPLADAVLFQNQSR